ncbi:MAG TPA: acetate kinase, partial [Clostridiales bacterium]|nr:acetate kinase [Clostridiales bacterium]
YLQEKEGWTPEETSSILNKKSGVLGISGVSNDDRDVRAAADEGNERAKLARAMQWYQIRKYIGSYIAAMEGVDAIAFAGGLGENTTDLRENICEKFAFMGVEFDREANLTAVKGKEAEITKPGSKIRVFVIPTNEELLIARDTKDIVMALNK